LVLRDRTEDEFMRTTRRFGPYLTLKNGMAYERASIEWARWAIHAIRARSEPRQAPSKKNARRRAV
jgi:hypothetical protein